MVTPTVNSRYVVLPRGINIGAHNRVPMADLRQSLTEAGFIDAVTILRSGNIIVTAAATTAQPVANPEQASATAAPSTSTTVAATVQQLLAHEFDVHVACIGRTAAAIQAIVQRNPLGHIATDGSRYFVNFLSEPPSSEILSELVAAEHSPDVVHAEAAEVYVWAPNGAKELRLSYSHLERLLGVTATARNWNTLKRIAAQL